MRNRILAIVLVSLLAFGAMSTSSANPKGTPNENAIGYWTADRRANAVAREFEFEIGRAHV